LLTVAVGLLTVAVGLLAVAVGLLAVAVGLLAVAVGLLAVAVGRLSVALTNLAVRRAVGGRAVRRNGDRWAEHPADLRLVDPLGHRVKGRAARR
jgi:hypothetical protein